MTYRQAIKNSLDTFTTERIELPNGTVEEPHEILPLSFIWFLQSLNRIMNMVNFDIKMRWEENGIKATSNSERIDDSIIESLVTNQIHGFIQWLLEQEAEQLVDDDELGWMDIEIIGKKWNEYAAEQNRMA